MKNLARSLILLLAIAGSAAAQPPHPEPGGPPGAPPSGGAPRDNDPAAMKARLERWLEETRHREEVIQAALKRLSEGASPDDVRKSMEPGTRPQRGGGGPQPRDGSDGRARREPSPGGQHDGGGGRPEPFDRDQVLAFVDKQNPEFAARMRTMLKDSPDSAERILGRLAPQIREITAERDDQTREIRTAQLKNGWDVIAAARETRELAKSGDTAARAHSIERVRDLLGKGFDLRVRLHEREVVVLEERLTKLKQELIEERSGRESFIAERLKQATEPRERRPDSKPDGKQDGKPQPKQ